MFVEMEKMRSRDSKSRYFFSAGFQNRIIFDYFLFFLSFFSFIMIYFVLRFEKPKITLSEGYTISNLFFDVSKRYRCVYKATHLGCVYQSKREKKENRHISLNISFIFRHMLHSGLYPIQLRDATRIVFVVCLLFSRKFPLWFIFRSHAVKTFIALFFIICFSILFLASFNFPPFDSHRNVNFIRFFLYSFAAHLSSFVQQFCILYDFCYICVHKYAPFLLLIEWLCNDETIPQKIWNM